MGEGKLVIRNSGLILSDRIEDPVLDGDCLIAIDGRIAAWGARRIWTPKARRR